ncbi:MAG: TonB-dependent receptor [Bacteroidia bacterium]|nr:TonB-dependent receptor [Bacteroidia bacterium]MDW8015275.1 TonB-dependent receptor [Bacteroidia bacterium]
MSQYVSLFLIAGLLFAQEERETGRPAAPRQEMTSPRPMSITLQGKVISQEGEPLPGAYVRVRGSVQGSVAGTSGEFRLVLLAPTDPIVLEASFLGYETATLTLPLAQAKQPLTITLQETGIRAQEVVISASRVSETIMNSSITVVKMSSREIQEAPGVNLFQNITFVKGTEQVSSSLTFQIINTRGFNSTTNTRFVQRLDGVEMQAPALNFPVGAITNAADLDIESVEITPGPASALYGPNAFNGIMNVYTKDPFRFPGLSSSVRIGVNHSDRIDTTPRPLYEIAFRYAKAWNNRLGFKVFMNVFDGHDWVAADPTDRGSYGGASGRYSTPGPTNPGYDAVNIYGDEARIDPATVRRIALGLGPALGGGLPNDTNDLGFYVARTGYWERDLIRYSARVLKGSVGAYYRLTDRLQLSYLGFISTGATVYQGNNRYSLREFIFGVNKLELSGPEFRIWAYAALEDAGNSYDSRFAALNLLNGVKSHNNWMIHYILSYTGQLYRMAQQLGLDPQGLGIPSGGDHAAARAYADSDRAQALIEPLRNLGFPEPIYSLFAGGARPTPGSPEFRQKLDAVARRPNFAEGGARFFDRSSLYHLEGQYDLSQRIRFINLLIGGNFRYFLINSEGTIFSDTTAPIGVWEYGAFIQGSRTFWQERVRLLASLRYDKNVNFEGRFTPRIGTLFAIDQRKNHNLRLSYQTGFRIPTLQAQYIDLNVGPFRLIGGLRASDEFYGIIGNNYSTESVNAFRDSLARRTRGSSNPADYADLLRTYPIENLRPERVSAVEVGSRHLIANRIYIDIDYAYSWYRDFIGSVEFVGPRRYLQADGKWQIGQLTPDSVAAGAYNTYRRYYNSASIVASHNFSIAFQYTISRRLFLNTNFTFAEIILTEESRRDQLIAQFNTPRYRANAYLTGREFLANKRLGFSIGYRWVNAYLFEEPFHSRIIPTYQLVDAQVAYKFPKINSQIRIGGQNILNNRHIEIAGGPTLGSLYYIQWVYDPFLP